MSVPLAAAGAAGAVAALSPSRFRSPRAHGRPGGAVRRRAARLGGQEGAEPKVVGDRPVQAAVVRAQGARDRARPPRQGHRPPAGHPAASRSSCPPSRRARCSAPRASLNVTLNTKVEHDRASTPARWPPTSRRPSAPTRLWAAGITGKGVGVAVIDSGITGDHADFKNADGTLARHQRDRQPGRHAPRRRVGHGTHVAGIIAGNSNNRADGRPARAPTWASPPRPTWSRSRPPTTHGNSTVLDVINALQFVVDHKDELNIQVVNLSVSARTRRAPT